jgi:hypothetical protein
MCACVMDESLCALVLISSGSLFYGIVRASVLNSRFLCLWARRSICFLELLIVGSLANDRTEFIDTTNKAALLSHCVQLARRIA